MTSLAVPTEFTDRGDDCKVKVDMGHAALLEMSCSNWARELEPILDGQGNLVLLGRDQEVPSAIVDPETGCYAVVRKPAVVFPFPLLPTGYRSTRCSGSAASRVRACWSR
jgi:hypothetical protein